MKTKGGSGGREGIRTPDPLVANQVLSQLSYTPIAVNSFSGRGEAGSSRTALARANRAWRRPDMRSYFRLRRFSDRLNASFQSYLPSRSDYGSEVRSLR